MVASEPSSISLAARQTEELKDNMIRDRAVQDPENSRKGVKTIIMAIIMPSLLDPSGLSVLLNR